MEVKQYSKPCAAVKAELALRVFPNNVPQIMYQFMWTSVVKDGVKRRVVHQIGGINSGGVA